MDFAWGVAILGGISTCVMSILYLMAKDSLEELNDEIGDLNAKIKGLEAALSAANLTADERRIRIDELLKSLGDPDD
jgi:hypothetical protein